MTIPPAATAHRDGRRRRRAGLRVLLASAVVLLVPGCGSGAPDSVAWCRALGRVGAAGAALTDPDTDDLTNLLAELDAALEEAPDELVPDVARFHDYVRDVDDLLVGGAELVSARERAERSVDLERLADAVERLSRAATDCGVESLPIDLGS